MQSRLFTLVKSDYVKAAVIAVLAPVVTYIYQYLSTSDGTFDVRELGKIAVSAFVAYLLKNFLTTSEGKFLGAV